MTDREILENAVDNMINSGSADEGKLADMLTQSMNEEQKKQLSDILNNEDAIKQLLATPEAAAVANLLNEIRGGK